MHTLESNPSIRLALAEWRAQGVRICCAQAVESREPRLDYAVIATRLIRFRTLRECFRDVTLRSSRGDPNRMRINVSGASDLRICAKPVEGAHGNFDQTFRCGRSEHRLITLGFRRRGAGSFDQSRETDGITFFRRRYRETVTRRSLRYWLVRGAYRTSRCAC